MGQGFSNSRVRKVGRANRTHVETAEDKEVIRWYRAQFQRPLDIARKGLESCISSEGARAEVTQRLKTTDSIVKKLAREPDMNLITMGDIGGCRAVFQDSEQLTQVKRRIINNSGRRLDGDKTREINYVKNLNDTGYRAVHIVTRYQGKRIEIQLRTQIQDFWATFVELVSDKTGTSLKHGEGRYQTFQLLRFLADMLAAIERGPFSSQDQQDILEHLDKRFNSLLDNETFSHQGTN